MSKLRYKTIQQLVEETFKEFKRPVKGREVSCLICGKLVPSDFACKSLKDADRKNCGYLNDSPSLT